MAPWLMLLAQMYAKKKDEEASRQAEVEKLQAQRVQRLGGNTMGLEAARFNREQSLKSYASPEELFSIYGQMSGGGKKSQKETSDYAAAGDLGPNRSAYSLQEPGNPQLEWNGMLRTPEQLSALQPRAATPPSDYQLREPDLLSRRSEDEDPRYMRWMHLR
jgi:hypothetical protein